MTKEIKYQAIWGKLYILLGILFGLLFVFGAWILQDFSIIFNLIASVIVIYIGYAMLNKPYATYSQTEIVVYHFLGTVRHRYTINPDDKLKARENNMFLNGKKLKLNAWMIDKKDWVRFQEFFIQDAQMMNELQD